MEVAVVPRADHEEPGRPASVRALERPRRPIRSGAQDRPAPQLRDHGENTWRDQTLPDDPIHGAEHGPSHHRPLPSERERLGIAQKRRPQWSPGQTELQATVDKDSEGLAERVEIG
jgi:hypothetical protein